jgi:hypothetical protein
VLLLSKYVSSQIKNCIHYQVYFVQYFFFFFRGDQSFRNFLVDFKVLTIVLHRLRNDYKGDWPAESVWRVNFVEISGITKWCREMHGAARNEIYKKLQWISNFFFPEKMAILFEIDDFIWGTSVWLFRKKFFSWNSSFLFYFARLHVEFLSRRDTFGVLSLVNEVEWNVEMGVYG